MKFLKPDILDSIPGVSLFMAKHSSEENGMTRP